MSRRRCPPIALVVALLAALLATPFAPGPARAQEPQARLARALEAYQHGLASSDPEARHARFRSAERDFAALVESGVRNPDLLVNQGNAALLAERPGAAILAYRRALRLDPDHRVANANLLQARALLPAWVPRPPAAGMLDTFFFWHRMASGAQRATLAALAFLCGAVLLSASWLSGVGWLRGLAFLPLVVWLAALASLALDRATADVQPAVVTAPEAVARAADSANAPARFSRPLPSGAEVSIRERRDGWLRIELADGREAWLTASSVSRVDGSGPGG